MPLDDTHAARRIDLLIPGMTCAGCMSKVERHLSGLPGVITARANLTAHRAAVTVLPGQIDAEGLVHALDQLGYAARPYDPAMHGAASDDAAGRGLLLRIGVAGFAAMNVMLLSISVWSGAEAATRDLLHWVSALIALPALAYAGQPFFSGAFAALRGGRMNMDVPISLAIILSAGNSAYETSQSGAQAYFDAGVMLIFFLLIGRYLEHRTRATARSAAAELMAMTGRTAMRVLSGGRRELIQVSDIAPGMELDIAPGERLPADGTIVHGTTDLDRALVTGESRPEPAGQDDAVLAGTMNLTGPIRMTVTATGEATFLAEIARMVDAAERGRGRYDRLADRIARVYAPAVHILAALAFAGWFWFSGDARLSVQIATAVLIVTCPCALALAVPTVHTVASARLFRRGELLKDGAELERLAHVDTVAFDKTGTLTDGTMHVDGAPAPDDPLWSVALALASGSRHPASRAIARKAADLGITPADLSDIKEHPGLGVAGVCDGVKVRLGRAAWVGEDGDGIVVQGVDGRVGHFQLSEALRPGAVETCAALRARGIRLMILSGDQPAAVQRVALACGIQDIYASLMPGDKLALMDRLAAQGRRVLMVGDGLNDTPALAAAHASMSPANAADVAKTSAGVVFTGTRLDAVTQVLDVAVAARRRALESFGIAAIYNAIAIPMAMAGLVTPLIAAVAMSASSVLVVLNALRLKGQS